MFIKPGFAGVRFGSWSRLVRWIVCRQAARRASRVILGCMPLVHAPLSVRNARIQEVAARCDKSEHLYRIKAKIFCDCTGDSRLGLEAGAEEAREG